MTPVPEDPMSTADGYFSNRSDRRHKSAPSEIFVTSIESGSLLEAWLSG